MDVAARIQDLAERARQQLPHIQTEEATKFALINPFIREVLGYNTADLTEVVPEYTADMGIKKGEKVDYAILRDGVPLILIEAKKAGVPLDTEEPSQLYRYFTATHSARFGIYTDGIKYRFYSDLDKNYIMDTDPFLVIDLLNPDPETVGAVSQFVKSEFNPGLVKASAIQLKYVRAARATLQKELHDPSEDLVRLIMTRIYHGTKTRTSVQQFKAYVKSAASQLIETEFRNKVDAVFATEPDKPTPTPPSLLVSGADIPIRWRYKGEEYQAVLQGDHQVRLANGDTVSTPSGACKALAGIRTINGWAAWRYYNEAKGKWEPISGLRSSAS